MVDRSREATFLEVPSRRIGKVAVVGAGPAGLTAAYYLTLRGYQVDVFEALPAAGGMMMVGIPEYRLPRNVLNKEIDRIQELGVNIHLNTPIGKDLTLDQLRNEGFQAFFVGIGAHLGNKLGIIGEKEYPQVYDAVSFLRYINLYQKDKPGDRVIVIGCGNVACDAARTSLRLGASEVRIVYRRTRDEMPALPEEVEQAEEEGVKFDFLTIPTRILGDGEKVTGVEFLRAELGAPDASGRRRPVPIKNSERVIKADAVIAAIGQRPDLTWFENEKGFEFTRWHTFDVDNVSMQTSVPDVFAGGDAVTGPATVVEAIGAGKRAAEAIDLFIRGEQLPRRLREPKPRMRVATISLEASEKARLMPHEVPIVPPEKRIKNFDQIELYFEEETARNEARRCLRCDLCLGCGDCAEICRSKMDVHAIMMMDAGGERKTLTDLLRVGERCIGCQSCTLVCPQGCLETVCDDGECRLVFCGTILARHEMEECTSCGKKFAPKRYIEYLKEHVWSSIPVKSAGSLCPECVRRERSKRVVEG